MGGFRLIGPLSRPSRGLAGRLGCLLLLLAVLGSPAGPLWADSRPRIVQFNELMQQQKFQEALAIIRAEIDQPLLDGDDYRADLRIVAISALGKVGDLHGWDDGLDREAERYFAEGKTFAAGNELKQTGLLHALYIYYSNTDRNGRALRYIREEMAYWRKVGNRYQMIIALDGLASVFHDMGELEAAAHHRAQALALADDYFVLGQHPSDQNEWLNYSQILDKLADEALVKKDAAALEAVWRKKEALSKTYLAFQSLTYLKFAEAFAVVGKIDKAEALYRAALEHKQADQAQMPQSNVASRLEVDFICTEVRLLLARGAGAAAVAKAAARAADCKAAWEETTGFVPASNLRLIGLTQEASGRHPAAIASFERAIAMTEQTRESFSLAQRANFFRLSGTRALYWGMVRASARLALASGGEADFLAALIASERIRGRQLGELVGESGLATDLAGEIRTWRQKLPDRTVVLGYVLAGDATVILGFDRTRHVVAVLPRDLRDEFRALGPAVADFGSDPRRLEARLSALGQTLLAPVGKLLEDKSELILLPDGAMNLVPFDLLSATAPDYRPLIEQMTVRVLPSLRFAIAGERSQAPAASGLFALGDPLYAAPGSIGVLSQAEVRSITGGESFLQYFQALPNTRREVQSIANLFGDEPKLLGLGAEASEATVKTGDLSGYRYLHFATHGILGGVVPGIGEPALVLAAAGTDDGFLKAEEASRLRLNADLTVLSACDTGSGRYVTGEGVLGLGRAFLVAGSRSVLVSLWPVETFATEDFMVAFYRLLRGGASKAAARREAALAIRAKQPHPAYWAPFILIGAGGEGRGPGATTSGATSQAAKLDSAQQGGTRREAGLGIFVAQKNANVRQTPNTEGAKIGRLQAGTEVRVLEKTKDWYRIQLDSGQGFVWAPLLTPKS